MLVVLLVVVVVVVMSALSLRSNDPLQDSSFPPPQAPDRLMRHTAEQVNKQVQHR
jgi:hypothetical protein